MSDNRFDFTVNLTMLSDWSVASGGGRQGSLHSVVVRDADELPYVPATTLRGMWRDAAEQVAFGLDDGQKGRWCELVDYLFGSQPAIDQRGVAGEKPIPTRLDLMDARFDARLREALRRKTSEAEKAFDKSWAREALTLVKPGVKIDPRSGSAQTNMLRFEEVARQDARISAEATLTLPDGEENSEAANALLCLALAATRLVDRIGGNRRRGAGRCKMTFSDVRIANGRDLPDNIPASADDAVERLAKWPQEPERPPVPKASGVDPDKPTYAAAKDDEGFNVIPLDVAVESPTVVAQAVLGNVITSLDYIPGTFLIQGVAQMLKAGLNEKLFGPALMRGDIRVLPAYPQVCGRRGLPTPLVFERKKDDSNGFDGKGRVRNRLEEEDDGEQWTPVKQRWFVFDNGALATTRLTLGETRQVTRTHNTVEDALQKPTQAVGGVYVYEAIAPGTTLKSELWVRKGLCAAQVLDALKPQRATIGRAKKAGYGSVEIRRGPLKPPPDNKADGVSFRLYFASDALLPPTPANGASTSAAAFLKSAIKAAFAPPLAFDVDVEVRGDSLRTARSENWVARWGLPRPSYATIRAGSVVVVTASAGRSFSADQLSHLQREGLGARRAEGFGDVLVDPEFLKHSLKKCEALKPAAHGDAPPDAQEQTSSIRSLMRTAFIDRIEDAALRAVIDFHAEQAAQNREHTLGWSTAKGNPKPNMSQLGNLRLVIADLSSAGGLAQAKAFVAGLAKSERAEKWGNGKADADTHPIEILRKLLEDPKNVWEKIGLSEKGGNAELDKALLVPSVRSADDVRNDRQKQIDAIVSFLFAAMRAHKRAIEGAERERENAYDEQGIQ